MKNKILFSIISLPLLFFSLATFAEAATLSFSPSSGSQGLGKTFSVSVVVGSPTQATNAVGGAVSFPMDKLEVVSLSKEGSIVSLWVEEPSFLNAAGTVRFDGAILNPGYRGSNGRILTINFRAKGLGRATLAFTSGEIYANDGAGTNIVTGLGSAEFTITPALPEPEPAPKTISPATLKETPVVPITPAPTAPKPAEKCDPMLIETPRDLGLMELLIASLLFFLLLLILILIALIRQRIHTLADFRRSIREEVGEAESVLHATFDFLKEDTRDQIKFLEKMKSKRELTREEKRILGQLKKNLDVGEKTIRKELEEIEDLTK